MLSPQDDFPIHQTAKPIAHPATSDLNFYDRYWFSGLSRDGEFMFEIAQGMYPNRLVADVGLGISRSDGWQHSLIASRRMHPNRRETVVAPVSIEVLEPMRIVRVVVEPNDTGIEVDLVFRARNAALEEPPMLMYRDERLIMETSRFTQFGMWEGFVVAGDQRTEVSAQTCYGIRDRSWGVRPIGEFQPGVPPSPPGVFWMWAPSHFDDFCTHFGIFEDPKGRRFYTNAAIVPAWKPETKFDVYSEDGVERVSRIEREIEWRKGTRRASRVVVTMYPDLGDPLTIEYLPELVFQMQGIGYGHPEYGHGFWQGEHALHGLSVHVAEADPLVPAGIHVHQLCLTRSGDREGIGLCEQLVYGPHEPSGFKELLDGAE